MPWIFNGCTQIPVNVAFIRATTSDTDGNLTMEHESMLGDTRQIAMAAKNSGGIVIAQVLAPV